MVALLDSFGATTIEQYSWVQKNLNSRFCDFQTPLLRLGNHRVTTAGDFAMVNIGVTKENGPGKEESKFTHTVRFERAKQALWIWPSKEEGHQPTIIIEWIITLDDNLLAGVFDEAEPFYHVKPAKEGDENDDISQTSTKLEIDPRAQKKLTNEDIYMIGILEIKGVVNWFNRKDGIDIFSLLSAKDTVVRWPNPPVAAGENWWCRYCAGRHVSGECKLPAPLAKAESVEGFQYNKQGVNAKQAE